MHTVLANLDDLTEVPDDNRPCPIIILFHNLKGFNEMFLYKLYKLMRTVETQLTVGAKALSFTCGPLTSLPDSFSITELAKGLNQQYAGRVLDLELYDPDWKSPKEKKVLEAWHANQERHNIPFNFVQEREDYCKSGWPSCKPVAKPSGENSKFTPSLTRFNHG